MVKLKIKMILLSVFIQSMLLAQHHAAPNQSAKETINWPKEYDPSESKFYVHNEIEIFAPPEVVWNILIQAETWPAWYEGAEDVMIQHSDSGLLDAESIFYWKTMGLKFESTIREYDPPYRLSWESKKKSIQGYHAWLIIPTENGCRVITDESQNGWLTFFEKVFQPNKLRKLHDIWLLELKKKAEDKTSIIQSKISSNENIH